MPVSTARAPIWAFAAFLGALVLSQPFAARLCAQTPGEVPTWNAGTPVVPSVEGPSAEGVLLANNPPAGAGNAPVGGIADGAQQTASQLNQLQQGVEKLGQNLKVTTVDKNWGLAIFGSLNGEMLFAQSRPFIPSGVVLLFPDLGRDTRTFEAHAKSTNIGAVLAGPEILGMKSGGMFLTYLYGEQFEADRYGFYVVRAFGELKNDDWRFAVGLNGDVINPLSPTTINFNAGQLAGNLGYFRAQFLTERYFRFSETAQLTTQLALSNPVATSFADFNVPPNNFLEDNGWPNLEGRVALGLGQATMKGGQQVRPVEFGCSGLVGQLRRTDFPGPNRTLDVWAIGADARISLTERLGFKGEFFTGQSIGNYNAAILQVNNDLLEPIRSTGGWGECYWYWTPCLHSHFGYGIDDPLDQTVTPGLKAARPVRNEFFFGNIIWDVAKNLELGFEVSHWETSYANITPIDVDAQSWIYQCRVRIKF